MVKMTCENLQKCVAEPNKPSGCREERWGDWEGRTVASCFIWAQLDLIFKWRTEAESADAVTMATELMGHTHSNVNDRTVCDAFVIAEKNGWRGRDQSRATQQSSLRTGDTWAPPSSSSIRRSSHSVKAGRSN